MLGHTLFLNDGAGAYEARSLPAAAQMSVGFGVAVADFDNDGHDDVFIAHNLHGGDPVGGGRYDIGVGQLLRGDGGGADVCFEPGAREAGQRGVKLAGGDWETHPTDDRSHREHRGWQIGGFPPLGIHGRGVV